MRQTYGKTFWGQQWLNTFNGIDDSNRLPRGRTYANKGAVFDVAVHAQHFTAKVRGSRRTPYHIHFEQRPFSPHEKNTVPALVERFQASSEQDDDYYTEEQCELTVDFSAFTDMTERLGTLLKKGRWLIRWLPALFDEAVTTTFNQLVTLCPEEWLRLKTKSAYL